MKSSNLLGDEAARTLRLNLPEVDLCFTWTRAPEEPRLPLTAVVLDSPSPRMQHVCRSRVTNPFRNVDTQEQGNERMSGIG